MEVKVVKKRIILLSLTISCFMLMTSARAASPKDSLIVGQGAHYEVTIQTSKGSVTLSLSNDTPRHRDNFVKLAREGFYDHLLFHRVIGWFMIQSGDPMSREASAVDIYGNDDAGYKLDAEIRPELFHRRGALAAAREPDAENPTRQSSSSQFYIVVGRVHNDSTLSVARERIERNGGAPITPEREKIYRTEGGTPHLDGTYTIFGQVTKGMGVVEKISHQPTDTNDRPKDDIFIKKVTVEVVKD